MFEPMFILEDLRAPVIVTTLEAKLSIKTVEPNVSLSVTITFVDTRLPLTVIRSRPFKSMNTLGVAPLLI